MCVVVLRAVLLEPDQICGSFSGPTPKKVRQILRNDRRFIRTRERSRRVGKDEIFRISDMQRSHESGAPASAAAVALLELELAEAVRRQREMLSPGEYAGGRAAAQRTAHVTIWRAAERWPLTACSTVATSLG